MTCSEAIFPSPFINTDDSYIRDGYTEDADSLFVEDIPTDSAFWADVARKNSTVEFITKDNVGEYPGWSHTGQFMGKPRITWSGGGKIPNGTYYILGHVHIFGNPTTSAIIVTDETIKVNGTPSNWGEDFLGYIAGKDIEISGGVFLQGVIYTKEYLNVSGNPMIFGAIYAGGNSQGGGTKTMSGGSMVIYNSRLQNVRWVIVEPKPGIASWQEVYE